MSLECLLSEHVGDEEFTTRMDRQLPLAENRVCSFLKGRRTYACIYARVPTCVYTKVRDEKEGVATYLVDLLLRD